MIEDSIHQECITVLSAYILNNRASKYVTENLRMLKGKVEKSTIRAKSFSHPLSTIDKTTQQKISKDIKEMCNTKNQQDLPDIQEHPT